MSKKVTLRQKIDGEDRYINVSERTVHLHEAAGWKVAPKTKQAEPAPESD
jgi:hypothetical protein